jgi:L-lactate dehydrogenase complex protein LldE
MRVALFVPCFMDQYFPRAAMATAELLTKLGCQVDVPPEQTCCGQPLVNSGFTRQAQAAIDHHRQVFAGYDAVVCPSGSCTSMVRHHSGPAAGGCGTACHRTEEAGRTYELCEFLHDVLQVRQLDARCAHRVGIHQACHGLRELRLGPSSERPCAALPAKPQALLGLVEGISLVPLTRPDECCGFGGMFAVGEPDVSRDMGLDRLADHRQAGAEIIASTDMSCLMHLEGLSRRRGLGLRFAHIAEILNGDLP